jgi:hypothetical protein
VPPLAAVPRSASSGLPGVTPLPLVTVVPS